MDITVMQSVVSNTVGKLVASEVDAASRNTSHWT